MIAWRVDRWAGWSLFDYDAGAATALISAIVAATLTFLGTAFAVLLIVVQFASTQLTPRALRVSLSDPLYRSSLGLFVATFVYSLVILARATKTFVPQLGMVVASILVVVSLAAYVMLISHLRISMRPVIVAARAGRLGRQALERIYPEPFREPSPGAAAADATAPAGPTRTVFNPGPPGTLVAFDVAGLVAEARRADALIMLAPAPGDFVRSGAPLFRLFDPTAAVSERRLLGSVVLGHERTMDQDTAFAFRILVDVAIKALSPAINDPTSAVMAIDQIHELLAQLGSRRLDIGEHRDAEGRVRLTVDRPSWEDYVSLAVDEIRRFGVEQLQVMRRLRAVFEDLLRILPDERKAAISRELALLAEAVRRTFPDPLDQERASEPDAQGIGSSPRPAAGAGADRVSPPASEAAAAPASPAAAIASPAVPAATAPVPAPTATLGGAAPTTTAVASIEAAAPAPRAPGRPG
jgi:uncharacterized membrane protein